MPDQTSTNPTKKQKCCNDWDSMKLIFVTTSLVFYSLIPLMMDTILLCSDVPEHLHKVAVNLAVTLLLVNNRDKKNF